MNSTTYSFQATAGNWYAFAWSKGVMKVNDENVSRGNCSTIWSDNSRDQYVIDEAMRIFASLPQYGIGPQATDCQEVADGILEKAGNAYLNDPKNSIGFGEYLGNVARDIFWY